MPNFAKATQWQKRQLADKQKAVPYYIKATRCGLACRNKVAAASSEVVQPHNLKVLPMS
jgi:hypothetical protein